MVKRIENEYYPDYVSPPGETLLELLDALYMTQVELAQRIGKSPKHINEIVKGSAPITAETALDLERAVGVPSSFWNNRERQYREALARRVETDLLRNCLDWMDNLPLKEMLQYGWLSAVEDPVDQLREVLRFFGVAGPDEWNAIWLRPDAAFRQSPVFEADPYAVAAWMRQGACEAQRLQCAPWDRGGFESALASIRGLTRLPPARFQEELACLCANAGVAVVFVPALSRTRASGVTRWLAPDKAMIQLSLRYKSDDHLWFTFFHEAGHLLRHGKREVFIHTVDGDNQEKEGEADRFAADCLIPSKFWRRFARRRRDFHRADILDFADEMGIAAGIVVGRLQHEGRLGYNRHNDLKRRLDWQLLPDAGGVAIALE